MSTLPLMPKATAVWLVDNTSLTFDQIATFCGLHVLEVKGIADGDVAQGIKGMDPISAGELTRDEIRRAQENPDYRMKISASKVEIPTIKRKKAPRYTPVSRRQDRPNAILWLLKYHPELLDTQIIRLVGTTKPTIAAIRDRSHWNSANLQAQDPVALGLCSQIDLDTEVKKAAAQAEKEREARGEPAHPSGTLLPTDETTQSHIQDKPGEHPLAGFNLKSREPKQEEAAPDADAVFANIGSSGEASEESSQPEADAASVFAKPEASVGNAGEGRDGDAATLDTDEQIDEKENGNAENENAQGERS